jgi:hypothetical protein
MEDTAGGNQSFIFVLFLWLFLFKAEPLALCPKIKTTKITALLGTSGNCTRLLLLQFLPPN